MSYSIFDVDDIDLDDYDLDTKKTKTTKTKKKENKIEEKTLTDIYNLLSENLKSTTADIEVAKIYNLLDTRLTSIEKRLAFLESQSQHIVGGIYDIFNSMQ